MAKKKKNIEDKAEETIDDLVDEFTEESQENITRVNTEPTILSEPSVEETKTYTKQEPERDVPRGESELEQTASEAPAPRRETIEYEPTPLIPITTREREEDDLRERIKYNPEELYKPKYEQVEVGRKEDKKKEEDKKIYTTTTREI